MQQRSSISTAELMRRAVPVLLKGEEDSADVFTQI